MGSRVRNAGCSRTPCASASKSGTPRSPQKTIGTRSESSLHRALKCSYAGVSTEVAVAGFVADGINAQGEFIEVQIGSFAPLRHKAQEFAAHGRLRIIHPIVITKYIEVFDPDGKRCYRRRSPRHGSLWDVFDALIHAPELPLVRNVVIELALVDVCEQRVRDGKGSWRRKGVSIKDRTLDKIHERICLEKPSDYLRFIPFGAKEQFTSADLSEKAGISTVLARKTLYVACRLALIQKTGKNGNMQIYQISKKLKKNNNPLNIV